MNLLFKTTSPENLKIDIIKIVEAGNLETWSIHTNQNVKYLKHTGHWGKKGVIQLTRNTLLGHLKVEILKFRNITDAIKDFEGYYLGRFCELVFVNFPGRFTSIGKE